MSLLSVPENVIKTMLTKSLPEALWCTQTILLAKRPRTWLVLFLENMLPLQGRSNQINNLVNHLWQHVTVSGKCVQAAEDKFKVLANPSSLWSISQHPCRAALYLACSWTWSWEMYHQEVYTHTTAAIMSEVVVVLFKKDLNWTELWEKYLNWSTFSSMMSC